MRSILKYLFETTKEILLVTSNENKLKEYKQFGLKNIKIEKGKDLKEIDSNDINVAIYKSKDAGTNRLIEDTSLNIPGSTIGVNIRWLLDNLNTLAGKKAIWKVLLGYNDGQYIYIYQGVLNGHIVKPRARSENSFGFDPFFVPDKNNPDRFTLQELDEKDMKDMFSARKLAIDNFIKNNFIKRITISDIPDWTGKYQH